MTSNYLEFLFHQNTKMLVEFIHSVIWMFQKKPLGSWPTAFYGSM